MIYQALFSVKFSKKKIYISSATSLLITICIWALQVRKFVKEEYMVIVLGPVVQSIVSLTSSLVVKVLTVTVSTVSNSQVFLLEKCE